MEDCTYHAMNRALGLAIHKTVSVASLPRPYVNKVRQLPYRYAFQKTQRSSITWGSHIEEAVCTTQGEER